MATDAPTTPEHSPDGVPAEVADAPFPYMRWAKRYLDPHDPQSLGLSGVPPTHSVGDTPQRLKAALAARYGVDADQVHLASGSSAANFIAYHALARGGRIAAETPAYQALHATAEAVLATLSLFTRDPAHDWRIDPESLDRAVSDGVDLIAVTDLHNPSGKALHPDDLALLMETAEAHDAYVLVDEVYLDFDPAGRPSAAVAHPRAVVTNSLTKCHGFGMLRVGWVLAQPDVIRRIEEADDLVNPVLPDLPMEAALAYLPEADEAMADHRARAAAACELVDAWVRETPGASWTRPDAGITGLIDLPVDGTAFCERMMAEHGVQAVPGAFFQVRNAVRVSFLLLPERLDAALAAMTATLRAMQEGA